MLKFYISLMLISSGITYGILSYNEPVIRTAFSRMTESTPAPSISPTIPDAILTSTFPQIVDTHDQEVLTVTNTVSQTIIDPGTTLQRSNAAQLSPTKKPIPSITKSTGEIPTNTPKPTTPTTKPTLKLTATPKPTLPVIPTVSVKYKPPQGLDADSLYNLVNNYRTEHGLPAFKKDETTCSIAYNRSFQVYEEIWVTNNMHAGLAAMQLPYWITENIINFNTEQEAFNWWINDFTHRQLILGNYSYSCTACYGYSCSQIFTDYLPK